jgi:hypothetical protein
MPEEVAVVLECQVLSASLEPVMLFGLSPMGWLLGKLIIGGPSSNARDSSRIACIAEGEIHIPDRVRIRTPAIMYYTVSIYH